MKPAVAFRKAALRIEAGEFVGCCNALVAVTGSVNVGLALARGPLADLLGYYPISTACYWWPYGFHYSEHETMTPRLIALELAAILSEENAAPLSKSRKS